MSTTREYCYKKALNKKLKSMGEIMKNFLKKLLSHEIFRSIVSWATNFFEKFVKPSGPLPPTYILYAP